MADIRSVARGDSAELQPVSGCFVRLGWLAGANVLLAGLGILIARGERWTLTAKDVAFWLIVPAAVALRYVDWKRFRGTTADGDPATARHIRRYAAWLCGSWSALWLVAQMLELG